jgi:hypothetical protein
MNVPEADIAALISANSAIMAQLTGGVYQSGGTGGDLQHPGDAATTGGSGGH